MDAFVAVFIIKHFTMNFLKYGVGIDTGMDYFDACIFSIIDTEQQVRVKASRRFPNTEKGFGQFQEWVNKNCPLPNLAVVYLMEATGVYDEQFAWYLHYKDCPVTVVLPNKAKKYKQSLGLKSKNERMDAAGGLSRISGEQRHTRLGNH
jgi:transposase